VGGKGSTRLDTSITGKTKKTKEKGEGRERGRQRRERLGIKGDKGKNLRIGGKVLVGGIQGGKWSLS